MKKLEDRGLIDSIDEKISQELIENPLKPIGELKILIQQVNNENFDYWLFTSYIVSN